MKKSTVKRIIGRVSGRKLLIGLCVLSSAVYVASTLAGPWIIGLAVDTMKGVGLGDLSGLLFYTLLLIGVYVLGNLFQWVLTYTSATVSYGMGKGLRHDMFAKLRRLPLRFFDRTPHGDVVSRFMTDVEQLCDGVSLTLAELFTGIITIIGAIVLMAMTDVYMTIATVASAIVTYYVARFLTTHGQQSFKAQAADVGELGGFAEEQISGSRLVTLYNRQDLSEKTFGEINGRLYQSGFKAQFFSALVNPTTRLVNNLTYTLVGVLGCIFALNGRLTVGGITTFIMYINVFSKPFNSITSILTQIQAGVASGERIFSVLDETEEQPDTGLTAIDSGAVRGTVDFSHVDFSYTKDRELIRDLNLTVKPGEKVAIVGRTGAGKTTLVNLLMRFYDVDSGRICLDGNDISAVTRASLRGSIGMVLQDTWLFEGSIRDNIRYGRPDATDEEVVAAAKEAGAHSFIKRMEDGYDTVINPAADTLSEGQKQLLTIARVMLCRHNVLILAEATSSIDTRTEIKIGKAFDKLMKGKTSFIIAHRLSTIREADIILVMDRGHIVESGSHDQLLKQGGYYARLWGSQFES